MTADFSVPEWSDRNYARLFPGKPARIFVNSMSDLADWKSEWFESVRFRTVLATEHLFLFLSKRPWDCYWSPLMANAMLGYSATNQNDIHRLVNREHCVSFLSLEPLHGPINIEGWKPPALRWIIVGAETGNRKGKVRPSFTWLRDIRDYALMNSIPLFFKESLRTFWTADGYFPQEYPA